MLAKSINYKIAVGGIEHETAGFINGNTQLDEFMKLRLGSKGIFKLTGISNTVIDGYVSGIK